MLRRTLQTLTVTAAGLIALGGCNTFFAATAEGDVVQYDEWLRYGTESVPTPTARQVQDGWGRPAAVDRDGAFVRRLHYWMIGLEGDIKYGTLTFDRSGMLVSKVVR